jgi:hypothetical protein
VCVSESATGEHLVNAFFQRRISRTSAACKGERYENQRRIDGDLLHISSCPTFNVPLVALLATLPAMCKFSPFLMDKASWNWVFVGKFGPEVVFLVA